MMLWVEHGINMYYLAAPFREINLWQGYLSGSLAEALQLLSLEST